MDLIERRVHFRVCDVQFPEVGELLWELYGNEVLEGQVIELTQADGNGQPYAVIRLERGARSPVIVAVDRLLP